MKRTYRGLLLLVCAALTLFAAGCGASRTPAAEAPPTETAEPTPHVHSWDGGVCTLCGEICEHEWRGGVCTVCGLRCAHEWKDGVCTVCGLRCEHEWKDGVCAVCALHCPHVWQNGACTICGMPCEHVWREGVCAKCGEVCAHERHDAATRLCEVCGMKVSHEYLNGRCTLCGAEPAIITGLGDLPKEFRNATKQTGRLENYHYVLGEGEMLPGKHPTVTFEDIKMRDVVVYTPYGYDPHKQYNVVILAPGAGHTAHQWLEWTNLVSTKIGRLRGTELLDRMLALDLIEPTIIVVTEYYLRGSPAEISVVFEKDLRERVLPFIAANYGTYASVDEEGNFVPAPEHYAFVGSSYGAMIGWQMLPDNTDLFAYWGLLSGGYRDEDEEALTARINAGVNEDRPVLYLYAGDGKRADGWMPYRNRMARLSDAAAPLEAGVNFRFLAVDRVGHNYPAWDAGLYNCLQIFFHSRYDAELLPPAATAESAG